VISVCKHLYVTLVLSVHSRDSLWLVVDRRLSYGAHRPPVDDAMKIMNLETTDGVGLLAYAGLGATSRGTQPSEWMSAVLRGRGGLTFEQALGALAEVATRELPRHLALTPGGTHFIIVPAFIRGIAPRLYTIDNVVDTKTGQHWYRYTKRERIDVPGARCPRIAVGGTGGIYLARKGDTEWGRALLSLANAHDRGRVSDLLIADRLARLNYEAHEEVSDGSVGPRCIVIWRRRPGLRRSLPAGGHQFYTGIERDRESDPIPTIANGMDVRAIARVGMKQFLSEVAGWAPGGQVPLRLDTAELNRQLSKLPSDPDEKLR
jgi:hypothetical protein